MKLNPREQAMLAGELAGRTPRYGLHLDRHRRATRRYRVGAAITLHGSNPLFHIVGINPECIFPA